MTAPTDPQQTSSPGPEQILQDFARLVIASYQISEASTHGGGTVELGAGKHLDMENAKAAILAHTAKEREKAVVDALTEVEHLVFLEAQHTANLPHAKVWGELKCSHLRAQLFVDGLHRAAGQIGRKILAVEAQLPTQGDDK